MIEHYKALSLALTIFIALALAACAAEPTPTPTLPPQPTYTPVPLSRAQEDWAYLVAVEGVWTVVEGVVEKYEGSFTGESSRPIGVDDEEKRQYQRYSEWSVRVVRYLVDPLPYERITLRQLLGAIVEGGTPLPHRFPGAVWEGEHGIFFLTKEAWDPLEDDGFTLWQGSPFAQGGVAIREGMVRWGGREETVEEFIARLQQYAQEAGRTVPTPTPSP